jgi:hypothetical protein
VFGLLGRPHLVQERPQHHRVRRPVGRQHLDRHPLPGRVLGQKHHADAVLADAVEDLVLVEDEPLRPAVEQLHRLELGEQLLADEVRGDLDRLGGRGVDARTGEHAHQVVGGEQAALADGLEEGGAEGGKVCAGGHGGLRPRGASVAGI